MIFLLQSYDFYRLFLFSSEKYWTFIRMQFRCRKCTLIRGKLKLLNEIYTGRKKSLVKTNNNRRAKKELKTKVFLMFPCQSEIERYFLWFRFVNHMKVSIKITDMIRFSILLCYFAKYVWCACLFYQHSKRFWKQLHFFITFSHTILIVQ